MKRVFFLSLLCSFVFAADMVEGTKISKYTGQVYSDSKSFDIQVSSVMNHYTREHRYVPLIVQVHNWTAANVRVSMKQFSLRDDKGNSWSPIGLQEYLDNHLLQNRRNLKYLKRRGDNGIETKKDVWYIENTKFYPLVGAGGQVDRVNLRPNFYCVDWLYFEQPGPGNYTLVFQAESGEEMTIPVSL